MRKIVKLFFTVVLIGSAFSFSSVYAEDAPGEEWDGNIKDPAGETIVEPTTPTEPEQPVPTPAPAPAPEPTPAPAKKPVSTPAPAPAPTVSTHEVAPEETPEETPEEEIPAEETQTAEETSTAEETPAGEPSVLVPETARPHTNEKIQKLALISTGIVVFTSIFTWCIIRIVKVSKMEKLYEEATKKATRAKNAKINRAG